MATVLTETGDFTVTTRATATGGLWLGAAEVERVAGWTLKPEGLCRADVCVPVPASEARDGTVDLAAFWRRLDHPVLRDDTGDVWVLGTGAAERTRALAGLAAPDFELPDLAGTPHRLSALRGKKVFLATWASW